MKRFHNMNAHVIDWKDSFGMVHSSLVSYKTLVCDIISSGKSADDAYINVVLFQHWRYSCSTTRQVTRFISETTGVKWTAKELDSCFAGKNYFVFTDYSFGVRIPYLFEKVTSKYGNINACGSMNCVYM